MPPDSTQGQAAPHQVEISLREIGQLFNTMDPSPFHERDLDHDAEEFIESWVREVPSWDTKDFEQQLQSIRRRLQVAGTGPPPQRKLVFLADVLEQEGHT